MPGFSGRRGGQSHPLGESGVSWVASGPGEQSLVSIWYDSDESSCLLGEVLWLNPKAGQAWGW